ncbi:hypothetical protein ACFQZE_13905 [Paenibacillus sp. GCM10027627]|uniref:hypothetical protein n=1 Tax=unclassified Paenibacillus TaxID=185978 RepID=UPI0036452BAB
MKLILIIAMLLSGALNLHMADGRQTPGLTELPNADKQRAVVERAVLQQEEAIVQPGWEREAAVLEPEVVIVEHETAAVPDEAGLQQVEAPGEPEHKAETAGASEVAPLTLDSVEGITLYDTPESVIERFGKPDSIEQDPIWTEMSIYRYSSFQISFLEEQLQYVDIPLAKRLIIDGVSLPMTEKALKERLGEPDFIADDGIVFQRGEAVLKLFLDEAGNPVYVSYFHMATA